MFSYELISHLVNNNLCELGGLVKRVSISVSDETLQGVDALARTLGCSRSALIEVLLARGIVRRLLEHRQHLLSVQGASEDPEGPVKRYRGQSIQDIEEAIEELERNYQGDLWHAIDSH